MESFNVFVILLLVSQHALCVEVSEGAESVLLPCFHGDPPADGVVWTSSGSRVHARKRGGDDLIGQDPRYVNRTSMRGDAPGGGDLSLTLTTPSVSDSGNYTCTARFKGQDLNSTVVQLVVTAPVEAESSSDLVKVLVPLGGIAALIAIIAIAIFVWRKQRRDRQGRHESHNQLTLAPLSPSVLKVESGAESVLLPFITPADLSGDVRVEWMGGGDMKVHVFENISDQPEEQHEDYRDRTQMRKDALTTGDLSLTLEYPKVPDSKVYTCTIRRDGDELEERQQVELQVTVPKVEVESGAESVQLPFITTADLSEGNKVEWMGGVDMKVHVYQNMSDQPGEHQDHRGGTHMNVDPLRTRDLSLTLEYPTVRDSKVYTCTIRRDGDVLRRKQVELQVTVPKVEVESGAEFVLLPFRTTANLPEISSLRWLIEEPSKKVHDFDTDHDVPEEQHKDYIGRTQVNKDSLGTGDLSLTLRRPTVRDSNTYTCRVYNQNLIFLREKTVQLEVKDRVLVEDEAINNRRSSSTDPTPLMADHSHQ